MAKRRKTRSIYQRADSRWALDLELPKGKDGKRRRKTIYGETPEEVEEKARAHQTQSTAGASQADPKTVDELAQLWLDGVKSSKSWHYYRGCRSFYEIHIRPSIGEMLLRNIKQQRLQRLVDNASSLSGRSKNILAMRLVALFESMAGKVWAVNPAKGISVDAGPKPKRTFLEPHQARLLLEKSKGTENEALWTLLLLCGLRIGEALGLQWGNIDFGARTITIEQQLQRVDGEMRLIPPKTKSSAATIPMPGLVASALVSERARQAEMRLRAGPRWRQSELVFCTPTGQPMQSDTVLSRLKALALAIGLPPITPHCLRHSTASLLVSLGVHIKVVQEIMRHSSYQITADTYSHVAIDLQRDALQKLDALFV